MEWVLILLGADDYLTKPFDAGELLARIRARVRKAADIKGSTISAFDIVLDSSDYQLKKGDKSIKLSKTEFQMLECLNEKPFQRKEVMDKEVEKE